MSRSAREDRQEENEVLANLLQGVRPTRSIQSTPGGLTAAESADGEWTCLRNYNNVSYVTEGSVSPAPVPPKCVSRQLTQVAAGHGGASLMKHFADTDSLEQEVPSYIMKVYDEAEARAYQELEDTDDALLKFTARYAGDFVPNDPVSEQGEPLGRYMRLTNLLANFSRRPHVMDCKVGCRSFLEEEVNKKGPRKDLYKKLLELDSSAPTPEEREAEACTKYRWMNYNDTHSTLRNLGFRIDGIAHSFGKVKGKELRCLRTIEEAAQSILNQFLPEGDAMMTEEDPLIAAWRLQRKLSEAILEDLHELWRVVNNSPFVQRHCFVGASLLFVVDAKGPRAGVFMIDFAKTTAMPEGKDIDHMTPWRLGNHEDGLFIGIDNMIKTWEEVLVILGERPPVETAQ